MTKRMLDLITLTDPRSPAAEAYQSLRTNLEFSSLGKPLHTLLLTSPDGETDKSITLANLAVVMAQAGARVIVVDGDLRRPRQHEIFGVANQQGLTNWLQSGGDPVLQESGVAGLQILPAGPLPPNPVALLSTSRLGEILADLRQRADYILCDAPPVLAVTDAALWASQVDGVMLAVNAGKTRREHAQRAKSLLERVQANLIGAILVNAESDATLNGYTT